MGRRITEVDYDATFHFTSDPETLTAPARRLRPRGSAQPGGDARSWRSPPGAPRPSRRLRALRRSPWTPTPSNCPTVAGPRTPAGPTSERSQFVIDGGILRNKPIRPAIDAVYRQPADQQVRRILAYVVPDPGEAATGPGKPAVTDLPGAAHVMLGVMTRLRSTDSVADELAEIGRRNARDGAPAARPRPAGPDAGRRRARRSRPTATDLVRSAYPGYLEVRRSDTAESVARLLLSAPRPHPWSQREVATVLRDLAADSDFPFIPQTRPGRGARRGPGRVALGPGHRPTARRPRSSTSSSGRSGWRRSPTPTARRSSPTGPRRTRSCASCGASERRSTPTGGPRRCPTAATDSPPGPAELATLRAALERLATQWGTDGPPAGMAARLHRLALDLAQLPARRRRRRCAASAPAGIAAVDSEGTEQARLRALVDLLVPAGATAGRRPAQHAPPRGGARRVHRRQRRPRAGRRAGAGQLAPRRAGHGRAAAPLRRLLPGVLAGQRLAARPGRRLRAARPDAPGARTAPAARPHGRGGQPTAAVGRRRAGRHRPAQPSWPRPGTPWTAS